MEKQGAKFTIHEVKSLFRVFH